MFLFKKVLFFVTTFKKKRIRSITNTHLQTFKTQQNEEINYYSRQVYEP